MAMATGRSTVAELEGRVAPVVGDNAGFAAESVSPLVIEISDKDYRSFCFPCHALEEPVGCNAGY